MLKQVLHRVSIALMAPAAATCLLGRRWFAFWAHSVAMVPGAAGTFVRRGFYCWVLDECASDVTIEFGAVFTKRGARLGRGVYVGAYALIGWATIGDRTLIGSRASLMSGGRHHEWTPQGWTPTNDRSLSRITIGADTWIGEGAILMADVGAGCMVAAGAVVSTAVPDGIMVAGNPARFVKVVAAEPVTEAHDVAISAVR